MAAAPRRAAFSRSALRRPRIQALMHFEGGNASPAFAPRPCWRCRRQRPHRGLSRACALGGCDAPLAAPDHDKLAALLRYGDPAAPAGGDTLVAVMPRLGTVSPWASKATDIAHNCGLAVHRIERVTEYRLA
jgi:phosphoribosylformylglycinamidine synthase